MSAVLAGVFAVAGGCVGAAIAHSRYGWPPHRPARQDLDQETVP